MTIVKAVMLMDPFSAQAEAGDLLVDGQPDWGRIDHDVCCGRCDYNLRLLLQPRCPECGLEFAWAEVLDRTTRRSKFLFEHHWRSRPVRSWLKTVFAALRPKRFWKDVSLHDHIHAGPLWFMLLSPVIPFSLVSYGLPAIIWLADLGAYHFWPAAYRDWMRDMSQSGAQWYDSFIYHCEQRALLPVEAPGVFLRTLAMIASGLAGMLAVLVLLWQTRARCRVRSVQMLRVLAYSANPMIVVTSSLLLFCFLTARVIWNLPDWAGAMLELCTIVVPLLVPSLYLFAGLRHYLRIPHAFGVALSAAVLGLIVAISVEVLPRVWGR